MEASGPFEPNPALAAAVSGGADSMALVVLAAEWVQRRGGTLLALVVDHGLRSTSAVEARLTIERLTNLGIAARLLTLTDLRHGPALPERARISRYRILTATCAQIGILHLLLGHHAADQTETVVMRVLRASQTHGLAGMSTVRETNSLRLLRPMLAIDPRLLRRFLTSAGIGWIEDPSNRDLTATRPRLRRALAPQGQTDLAHAIASVGRLRQREETETAADLACRVTIRSEGFAVLSPGRINVAALRSLILTIGGASYPPSVSQIKEIAAWPRPATVAGVRILAAGRHGDGWLIVREEAAVGAPVPVAATTLWDGRFRLIDGHDATHGAMVGMLGNDAARFRGCSELPSVVLKTLPAVRIGTTLVSVPHLGYAISERVSRLTVLFSPARPGAGATWLPGPH